MHVCFKFVFGEAASISRICLMYSRVLPLIRNRVLQQLYVPFFHNGNTASRRDYKCYSYDLFLQSGNKQFQQEYLSF